MHSAFLLGEDGETDGELQRAIVVGEPFIYSMSPACITITPTAYIVVGEPFIYSRYGFLSILCPNPDPDHYLELHLTHPYSMVHI